MTADMPQKRVSKAWLARCGPHLQTRFGTGVGGFKMKKGERYSHTPVIAFLIRPDGSTTDVKLTQSSGIKRLDDQLLKSIARWKYKPRPPDCPVLETSIGITVDWW